jgi:outer membrane protein OmpA-like peptidoglycan-associated protein
MIENTTISIEIDGHTDPIGDSAYNQALSVDRAKSVVQFLQEKGISLSRLYYRGWGARKAIAPNTTEEGRRQNRRTEIIIRHE